MKIEPWHRRQALSIAAQLPEDNGDARAVIECVSQLVTQFLRADEPKPVRAPVVTLVRPNRP